MAEKHTVAMFIQEDGERKQVGWASPQDENGVRTFEFSPGYSDRDNRPQLKNVSFEDDELTQKIAAEQEAAANEDGTDGEKFEIVVEPAEDAPAESPVETAPTEVVTEGNYPQAGDEGKDSAPLEVVPNEELAAEPVQDQSADAAVEVEGGEITEVEDADAKREEAIERQKAQQARRQQNRNKGNNQNRQGGK